MSEQRSPDFILGGVGKAATTWVHECFTEHPGIAVPESDSLGFFDRKYARGYDWYENVLPSGDGGLTVGESSPSYLYDQKAPERIKEHAPDATLLFILRNPVERAYSHWWHGYSDGYWTYEFDELRSNYPPYQMWVVPGFYDHHLQRYEKIFDEQQIEILFYDDLVDDDVAFIKDVFGRIGVDSDFTPEMVGEKMNTAHYEGPNILKRAKNWVKFNASGAARRIADPVVSVASKFGLDRSTYEDGMNPETRPELESVYREDVESLMDRTGRDLGHWFEYESF